MKPRRSLHALFLAIIVVGVLHMAEQLLFGIEEFYLLRGQLGRWYTLFDAAWADNASVLLITVVFTAISLVFYALVRGGQAPLVVMGAFGVLGVGEAHHWIEAFGEGGYDPGLVTSVAYVWLGALILLEVRRRWPAPAGPVVDERGGAQQAAASMTAATRAPRPATPAQHGALAMEPVTSSTNPTREAPAC
jgi:hypothetical protein